MHRFHIPGMKCGGCLGAVTRAVEKLDPQARVSGDLETRQVVVESQAPEVSLLAALREAGYPAQAAPQPAQ
jgi:copper chaperone